MPPISAGASSLNSNLLNETRIKLVLNAVKLFRSPREDSKASSIPQVAGAAPRSDLPREIALEGTRGMRQRAPLRTTAWLHSTYTGDVLRSGIKGHVDVDQTPCHVAPVVRP